MILFFNSCLQVTLFGAEAGCQSVAIHLTSLTSDPLFHAAILHSCPLTVPFHDKNESRQMAHEFASALGCADNDVDCYRRKSVQEILQAQVKVTDKVSSRSPSLRRLEVWGPILDRRTVYDSNLLEEVINDNLRPPHAGSSKPVMLGVVGEEGQAVVYRNYPLPVSSAFFQRLVEAEMPEHWRRVADSPGAPYRPVNTADARDVMSKFIHDYVYACPAQRLAKVLGESGGSGGRKVWMYMFEPQVTLSPGGWSAPARGEPYCQDKACQGLDLLYLFNAIPDTRRPLTEGLSQAMVTYWSNFAKYFNPNGAVQLQQQMSSFQGGLTVSSSGGGGVLNSLNSPTRTFSASGTARTSGTLSTALDRLPPYLRRLMQSSISSRDRTLPAQFSSWTTTMLSPAQPVASVLGSLPSSSGGGGNGGGGEINSGVGFGAYPSSQARSLTPSTFTGTAIIDPNSPFRTLQSRYQHTPTSSSPSSLLSQPPGSPTVEWPATSSTSDVILVLTQPGPVLRQSLLAGVCEFWEGLI
jgi:hypothetical protein